MDWLITTMRSNPSLAVFLVIGLGFFIGSLKYKSFSLGTVTSVLLVGVLVGQLDIPISGPLKDVSFLLFLFAIGYSVGPQFFQALRGDGLKQVGFAVVICVLCLAVTVVMGKLMHYSAGETIGLFSGSMTISAVIGVGTDTLGNMGLSQDQMAKMTSMIPVCYAVTYLFGTIGSAYLLANLGPALLGGIKKVKAETAELSKKLNTAASEDDPAVIQANRPVAFRAYKISADYFNDPHSVADFEAYMQQQGRRVFVERLRDESGTIINDPAADTMLKKGCEVVLSGRREAIVGDESWIGQEVTDAELLNFPATQIDVTLTKKGVGSHGMTVEDLRHKPIMRGIVIKGIKRAGVEIPFLAQVKLMPGDILTIIGLEREVNAAAPQLGYADRPTTKTDLIFVGMAVFIGGIIGALTLRIHNIPISLSTSGGALISGLFFGWLRSKHPTFGRIPQPAVWLMNNLGLNLFIAVIGITSGPSFVSGFKEVGLSLFLVGFVCTSVPLILGVIIGHKLFKFPAAINLGCCAGSRTTTASLGAIQEAIGSSLPAMGYTVTYAIGNTLLILWGVAIVLLMM